MADEEKKIDASLNKTKENIQTSIDKMHANIYMQDNQIPAELDYIRNKVHKALSGLMINNMSNTGMSNISSLYDKTNAMELQNDKGLIDKIESTFENDSIMNNILTMYSQNSYLRDLDNEIDMICKYMPKLDDALDTRREHVLSADHFSKNPFKIVNTSATSLNNKSVSNIKQLKEKYNIDSLIDLVYRDTDKRGEVFVYVVPYKKAIAKLLPKAQDPTTKPITEEFSIAIEESTKEKDTLPNIIISGAGDSGFTKSPDYGFNLQLDKSGVLKSAVEEYSKINDFFNNIQGMSINEQLREECLLKEAKEQEEKQLTDSTNKKKANKSDNSSIELDILNQGSKFYKLDSLAADGVKVSNTTNPFKDKKDELKIPGAVVKILDHTMVKPLYIDDTCLGYFYIECEKKYDLEHTTFSSTLGGVRPGGGYRRQLELGDSEDTQENQLLKKIAMNISNKIDKAFVNANQDLSKEIYLILKYNRDIGANGKLDKMRITFIPPEDMVHGFFEQDKRSHRGISGLLKALFPAKLYTCLYISNTIQILTRGNDKRVYYVKQNVDTNISASLLNVLNQIQKSNFGLRQIESMNNVLNIIGRFNDHIIPRGPGGDTPVDIEVIPGQNVEIKTDLMNLLEEMAINSTEVPVEVIQMRQQVDYATQLTMTNTKFLQKIYNRQSKFQNICNKILTKIYDAEYECQDSIEMQLPPPMYLNVINTSQIIQSVNDLSTAATEMYAGNKPDEVKTAFTRNLNKVWLASFLPEDRIEQILIDSEFEVSKAPKEEEQQ